MNPIFDHEKLKVYKMSLELISWTNGILQKIPKTSAVWSQLDRSTTSIPLNIAEGNGKYTPTDRCRFFDNARGSAFETAACLDVLVAKGKLASSDIHNGKLILQQIVSMLIGLIKSNSPNRMYEDIACYSVEANGD